MMPNEIHHRKVIKAHQLVGKNHKHKDCLGNGRTELNTDRWLVYQIGNRGVKKSLLVRTIKENHSNIAKILFILVCWLQLKEA